jgi:hypothetical protein
MGCTSTSHLCWEFQYEVTHSIDERPHLLRVVLSIHAVMCFYGHSLDEPGILAGLYMRRTDVGVRSAVGVITCSP